MNSFIKTMGKIVGIDKKFCIIALVVFRYFSRKIKKGNFSEKEARSEKSIYLSVININASSIRQ